MKLEQRLWTRESGWARTGGTLEADQEAELVLVFGASGPLCDPLVMGQLRAYYPNAYLYGCSAGGEIQGDHVYEGSVSVTAIRFEGTTFQAVDIEVEELCESFVAGAALADALPHAGLVHAFVLCDGLAVYGSELVRGLVSRLPQGVAVTGGLGGDVSHFAEAYVCVDGLMARRKCVLLGFYGDRIHVSFGLKAGWDPFGLERRITKSRHNVLYELDGRSALDLYKKYLGPHASRLPASASHFPLALREENSAQSVMRGCLAVNEAEQSMTFAADMPEGALVTLMQAHYDRLIDGAGDAARMCQERMGDHPAELSILVSCVARKVVLKQRIEEEVEAVQEVLGSGAFTTGFYSCGEICPSTIDGPCALHNQNMTITTLSER